MKLIFIATFLILGFATHSAHADEIEVVNNTCRTLRLAVYYPKPGIDKKTEVYDFRNWRTASWWTLDPDDDIKLRHNGRVLKTTGATIYFRAESTDGERTYIGQSDADEKLPPTVSVTIDGKRYRMGKHRNWFGDITIRFKDNKCISPVAARNSKRFSCMHNCASDYGPNGSCEMNSVRTKGTAKDQATFVDFSCPGKWRECKKACRERYD